MNTLSNASVPTLALVGAGDRGLMKYGSYLEAHPEEGVIVAVAEPREWYRNEAVRRHGIRPEGVFADWRQMVAGPRCADAVIITTQDAEHREPAVAFMEAGYDVLLEKPMAPSEEDCRAIVDAAKRTGVFMAVCHVLRYSPYFRKMKEVIESGVLGEVTHLRHIEQVGYWHFAHSYVRGNWRNEALASPVILAKCCHDMDIMLFLLGKSCVNVAGFGSLSHFRKDRKPARAASRCTECPLADGECPYSATSYYLGRLRNKELGWPLNIITPELTESQVMEALRTGPYGRCVYECDNDVVDHQTLALEFEGGITADFTMIAHALEERRYTDVFGSHGELRGDGRKVSVTTFADGKTEEFPFVSASGAGKGGHLGGDAGLMKDFLAALRTRNPELIRSGPEISLMSHVMAFAAESSRKESKVVPVRV